MLLCIPYLISNRTPFHPSQEWHCPRAMHLTGNPFADSSIPFTPVLPHDRVGYTCQQNIISSRQIVTRCYSVEEEMEMDPESLNSAANENETKGKAISIAKSLCSCFVHIGEEWNQI